MNIIYLYPVSEKPTGGIKVAYRHSEMLKDSGLSSEIFHSKNPKGYRSWFWQRSLIKGIDFNCSWFEHNASLRSPKQKINGNVDFVVIPEIWAAPYGNYFKELGIPYAIFNQGAYSTRIGCRYLTEDDLKNAYEGAEIILSISEDTTKVISFKFPFINSSKIIRIIPGIDPTLFSSGRKEKLITYMPTRLPEHIKQVMFFLRDLLPPEWVIFPVINKSEKEVAEIFSRSSIFLSFCDQEGCPLPPLEAAFSGNIVVGYTGQGANEYFQPPVLRKVENGDFITFTKTVLQAITEIEDGILTSTEVVAQVGYLKKIYSLESARVNLLEFGRRVQSLMEGR